MRDKTDETDLTEDVVSATECTGLVQRMPLDDEEESDYREIYRFVSRCKK